MKKNEISNLNIDDLDVDELEARLELAPTCAASSWCGCGSAYCDDNKIESTTKTR